MTNVYKDAKKGYESDFSHCFSKSHYVKIPTESKEIEATIQAIITFFKSISNSDDDLKLSAFFHIQEVSDNGYSHNLHQLLMTKKD